MNSCFEKNELENYLTGWADEATGSAIESHVAQCRVCEQAVTQLESETKPSLIGISTWAASASRELENEGQNPETISENHLAAALDTIREWDIRPLELAPARLNINKEPELGAIPPSGSDPFTSTSGASRTNIMGDFGHYHICELIGRGGMAEVYRARHKRLDRDVAIKLLRVPQSQIRESLNRIEREIRAVGRLKHPSIVSAVDAGEQDGVQYLATEFIDGLDLGKIARAVSPMPVAEACEMIRQAALGLDYAHANGAIHRDIKPSNLMLEKDGVVKILDFGLVRLDECSGVPAELTSVGQLLGTLDYMAPEQADRADSVDHRSDIYSLGATLFRLLAGRAPYAATTSQSPLEKLRLLALDQPPKIQTLRPDLSDELAAIIDQTLSRDPAQRPASAAHLAEKLEPFCSGANVTALITQAKLRDEAMLANECDARVPMNSFLAGGSGSIIAQAPIKPAQASAGADSKRIRRWLIGLGFTAAAMAAGIVLVLETQKGKVIIETDSPKVHVRLVADDGRSQGVRVVPGKTETRVYAGRYEIQIDDGTDSYTIDKNAFILNRGETVVAKVRVDEEAGKADVEWSENSQAYQAPKPSTGQDSNTWLPVTNAPRRIAVYQTDEDAEFLARVLESVLEGKSDCRMEVDAAKNRLVIYAPEWVHREIQRAIEDLASTSFLHRSSTSAEGSMEPLVTESEISKKPAPMLTEPVFEGHGVSYWLNRGEFETDYKIIEKANYAVDVLTGKYASAREQARSYLVSKPVSLEPSKSYWFGRVASNAGLDDKHAEALLSEIQTGSLESVKSALGILCRDAEFQMRQQEKFDRPKLIESIEVISSRADLQGAAILTELSGIIGELSSRIVSVHPSENRKTRRQLNEPVYKSLMHTILDTPWLGASMVLKINRLSENGNEKFVQIAFLKEMNSGELTENELKAHLREINEFIDSEIRYLRIEAIDQEFSNQLISSLDSRLKALVEANETNVYRMKEDFDFSITLKPGSIGGLLDHFLTRKKFRVKHWGAPQGNNLLVILATVQRLTRLSGGQILPERNQFEGLATLVRATKPGRERLYNEINRVVTPEVGEIQSFVVSGNTFSISYLSFETKNGNRFQAARGFTLTEPLHEDLGMAIAHEAATELLKVLENQLTEANPDEAE